MQDSPNRSVFHVVVADHHYPMLIITMDYRILDLSTDVDIVLLADRLK